MRRLLKQGALLLLPLLAAPLAAQQSTNRKGQVSKAAATQGGSGNETKAVQVSEDPAYVIGAQDVLDINVWKEAEITRTVPVRPDGKISLPLVRDIQAAGFTPMQLERLIAEKLQKYITDPQVTVIVKEINSRRIYILGEVNRAGTFTLLPNMTVLQALSGAGGFTQFANVKGIYVSRLENGKQVKYPFNYKAVVGGETSGQNILLKPGDTIVVP